MAGLMSPSDWAQMQADLTALRDDNVVSVALRRGSTTLAAQSMRIAQAGRQAARQATGELEAATTEMTLLGDAALDIEPGDRLTVDGMLLEVTTVAVNRLAGTRARARMVQ
jgi:hypothetical protein